MAEPETQELGQDDPIATNPEKIAPEPGPFESIPNVSPETPILPQAAKRRGMSVLVGLLAGGALAAAGGFGLARYVVPEGWPLASTAALSAKLAEQAAQIDGLKASLAQATATLAALPTEDRIAAVEATLAKPADASQFAALAARIDQLEKRPAAQSGPAPTPTAAEEAAAQARLAEAKAQADALNAEAAVLAKSTALHAALGKVQMAVDAGQPFSAALADLQSAGLVVPDALQAAAKDGVPALKTLQTAFPDAARLALDAALRANMGETTTDRLTSFLRSQTGARSLTPYEGSDPDAVLSRAEAALAAGDLATSFAELAALPAEAQPAMADWLALAQRRAQALDGLAALTADIQ